MTPIKVFTISLCAGLSFAGCSAGVEVAPLDVTPAPSAQSDVSPKNISSVECKDVQRPRDPDGQPYETLDAYLKFRKSQGAFDRPFYEEQDDGRYKLNRGRGERFAEPVYFTRADLAAKYGFACPE